MASKIGIVRLRKPAAFSDHGAAVLRVVAAAASTVCPSDTDVRVLQAALAELERPRDGSREQSLSPDGLAYLRSELDTALPKLLNRVIADLPAPGERTAVTTPGALSVRLGILQALLRSTVLPEAQRRTLEKTLIERIAHAGIYYHRWLIDSLEKADPVDVRSVSFDQFRLDIILWLLEDLGAMAALNNVRSLAQVAARAALRRAGAVIDDYIRTRGPSQRFDVAVVVSQVEELGTLVTRVLESVRVDDFGVDSQGTLSRALAEDFIHSCGLLVLATFRDLDERHAAGKLNVGGLEGALKQIMTLRTFIHGIDAPGGTRIRLAVDRTIARRARSTVALITTRMAENPDAAKVMLRELAEFLALAQQPDDNGQGEMPGEA
ncbi:MAG: hypothetical protein WCZ23_03175 [Rhodospirillaceae bacterium]